MNDASPGDPFVAIGSGSVGDFVDPFVAAWGSGRRPALLAYVPAVEHPCHSQIVRELVRADLEFCLKAGDDPPLVERYRLIFGDEVLDEPTCLALVGIEFLWRWRRGEEGLTRAEYQRRFPDLAEHLDSSLRCVWECPAPCLQTNHEPNPQASQACCPHCGTHFPLRELHRSYHTVRQASGSAPAGYEILGQPLGRGAMGIVYRARQVRLQRIVALKLISAGFAVDAGQAIQRVQLEAEALARLRNPHVVQIYEAGEHGGLPYIAMELVEGGTLEHRAPLPCRDAAWVIETLAGAIQAAHSCGVIHRDLKPANILVQQQDEGPLVVKITDFGLARLLDSPTIGTALGEPLGTPPYLAPEQAAGHPGNAGPAADVYALGAILYELLTGRPPFAGESRAQLLQQVLHNDPIPPRKLHPGVPRSLETICLRCLEKDPGKRMRTAQELADELGRFRRDEPIHSRPTPPWERAWKWTRRHRWQTAALVASVFLAASAILAFVFWVYWTTDAYHANLNAAREEIAQQLPGWSRRGLARIGKTCRTIPHGWEPAHVRTAAVACLIGADLEEDRKVEFLGGRVAFSQDSRYLAAGEATPGGSAPDSYQITCLVIDLQTPMRRSFAFTPDIVEEGKKRDDVHSLAFVPADATGTPGWLVVGTRAGRLHFVPLPSGSDRVTRPAAHAGVVEDLVVVESGKTAVVYSASKGMVKRWSAAGGWKEAGCACLGKDPVKSLAFHTPSGRLLVLQNGLLHTLDGTTLHSVGSACQVGGGRLGLHADAQLLAVENQGRIDYFHIGPDARLTLVDPGANRQEKPPHLRELETVQISPSGQFLVTTASSDQDRRLILHDTVNRRALLTLAVPGHNPIAAAFSPDGSYLAVTVGEWIRTYRLSNLRYQRISALQPAAVRAFAWSPDETRLAVVAEGKAGRWISVERAGEPLRPPLRRPVAPGAGEEGEPSVSWHPRDALIAFTATLRDVHLLSLGDSGKDGSIRSLPQLCPRSVTFDSDGRLWCLQDNTVLRADSAACASRRKVWFTHTPSQIRGRETINALAVGQRVVLMGCRDGTICAKDQAGQRIIAADKDVEDAVRSVALGPNETCGAVGTLSGAVWLVWPADAVARRLKSSHADSVETVAFSPNQALLVSGSRDGTVKFWHQTDGMELMTIRFSGPIRQLAFQPGGAVLGILVEGEYAVRFLDLDALREECRQIDSRLAW